MRVLSGPWFEWPALQIATAITIGVFDGVHLGHRRLLDSVVESGMTPAVLTFDPHPAEVLAPGSHPRLLTTVEERIELLDRIGIELVGVLDLAEIRSFPPERFVGEVLIEKLGMSHLVTGTDFHFGRDRAGDVEFLMAAGERLGFTMDVVELKDHGGVISSSRIRALIENGEVADASDLLGSNFTLTNIVVAGDRRGRELGFPTANLEPPVRKVIPGHGIYAGRARIEGRWHAAAINVGVRPTFGGTGLVIEAYILDFERDLYGEALTLEFVEKLRPELKFDSVADLISQMKADVEMVRAIVGAPAQG
ncbi:MAG: bifunctional riboflavin kinase/FAD synthetase [Acidimicrobiia bacterium]